MTKATYQKEEFIHDHSSRGTRAHYCQGEEVWQQAGMATKTGLSSRLNHKQEAEQIGNGGLF